MSELVQNIEITRGDHEEFDVMITDEDDEEFDISGAVIKFTAKEALVDADENAVILLSSEDADEIAIIDAEAGLCTIYISEEVSIELVPRNYFYDVQIRIDEKPKTVASGILTVLADVTRDLPAEP